MTIEKKLNDGNLEVKVSGRLDTTTAPQLEEQLGSLDGVSSFVFDFSELEYISSAGLRVVLMTKKKLGSDAKLTVKNLNSTIKEVFDITGFSGIIDVE